jgi:putative spermidine/putrescine transport system permease protein
VKPARWLTAYSIGIALLTALPLAVIVPVSLNPDPVLRFPTGELSLSWYQHVFTGTTFPEAFVTSGTVALIATLISIAVGTLAAWTLTRRPFRGSGLVQAFLMSPLMLARIVYGVAMLIVLTQVGLIRTTTGLVIAHAVVVTPYVVRIVGGALLGVANSLEEASAVLGSGQVRTFWYVTLPMLRPAILAAGIFSLITSFDEFTMSVFLVGPRTRTLPVEIFKYVELIVDPSVAAVSVLLILLSLVVMTALEKLVGLEKALRA